MEHKEMENLLQEANFGRLGLAKGAKPYVVPLCFYYENKAIYFHCGLEGQKLDYMRENNLVCFQVDDVKGIVKGASPCKYNVQYRSVIAFGKVRLVEDNDIKQEYLGKLAAKYIGSGKRPKFSEEQLASVNLAVIEVESLTGKAYPPANK